MRSPESRHCNYASNRRFDYLYNQTDYRDLGYAYTNHIAASELGKQAYESIVSVVDHRADDAEMIADTAFECLDVYAFVVTVDATPLRLLNHTRVEPIASYA